MVEKLSRTQVRSEKFVVKGYKEVGTRSGSIQVVDPDEVTFVRFER